MNCFELNRFIGYATEEEALVVGTNLISKNALWAALIFQNPSEGDSLPKIVNYKIRMSSQFTHDTNFAQNSVYTFGQENCFSNYKKENYSTQLLLYSIRILARNF